jgi:hypothetical protein
VVLGLVFSEQITIPEPQRRSSREARADGRLAARYARAAAGANAEHASSATKIALIASWYK